MYYIDFDNTLYETGRLTKEVLTTFAKIIATSKRINVEIVLDELKKSFNSTVDNFESFANGLAVKYGINSSTLQLHLRKILVEKGCDFTFPDGLRFLKRLNEAGENICILTYVAQKKNLKQQSLKLAGSGILPYINEVHATNRYKYELFLDYKHGTFIDDDPRDLEGLYKAGAKKLIRIKKPNNTKRTSKALNIPKEIPTYESFDDIPVERIK